MLISYMSHECSVWMSEMCGAICANKTKTKSLTHLVGGGLEGREERVITKQPA